MKSFLEGRPVVSREGAPVSRPVGQLPNLDRSLPDSKVPLIENGPSTAQSELPPAKPHGEKKVETVEVGGVVQKIIVTCSCGERIEVFCGY